MRVALTLTLAVALLSAVPAQIITVDNSDAGFSVINGTWGSSANAGFYGTNSLFNSVGTGTDIVRWTPTITVAGTYEVYAWWVASANRGTNSPYTTTHASGSNTVRVNQVANGGQWNFLGSYNFNVGTGGYVQLSDDATGTVVSADAVQFRLTSSCGLTADALTTLSSAAACNQCSNTLLPGAAEAHPETKYHIISDLPEILKSTGVLYVTQSVLPPYDLNNGDPQSLSMRTQTNAGFTTIDDDFEVFLFHITSPGDGSTPRRIVIYVRNEGTGNVTITPKQSIVTDGTIGTVHQMESNLGAAVLSNGYTTPVAPLVIAPGTGEVVAYGKRFGDSANTSDRSANVNCFGHVRAQVTNANPGTHPTNLKVYVIAIGGAVTSQNKTLAEALLTTGADSGEASLDLSVAPSGCDLRRATGVFENFVWRSDTVTVDTQELSGSSKSFQMALPQIQSSGCSTAQQTEPLLLYPPYVRPDTVGNYMTEYRVTYRVINRSSVAPYDFDLLFGKTGADIGLAWQVAVGATPPSDATVDAAAVRTGWAGPFQTGDNADNTRSFLESDGGAITVPACGEKYVAVRFLILGNASLPFQVHTRSSGAVPVTMSGFAIE